MHVQSALLFYAARARVPETELLIALTASNRRKRD
jgi:hypothetical protein